MREKIVVCENMARIMRTSSSSWDYVLWLKTFVVGQKNFVICHTVWDKHVDWDPCDNEHPVAWDLCDNEHPVEKSASVLYYSR